MVNQSAGKMPETTPLKSGVSLSWGGWFDVYDLTWDMVKLEGEDENFEQWKTGNIRYWTRDAAKRGYTFTDQTPITFERFEVVEVL